MKQIQDSYKKPISFPGFQPQPTTVTTAIVPLQPQETKIMGEWERLVAQAQRINQIAGELELAMLELKAMASRFNSQRLYLLTNGEQCQNICQYFSVSVPWIRQKPDNSFILTMRKVDLFRAEREAKLLAQELRQQSKTRLASQEHRRNKREMDVNKSRLLPRTLINKS